MRVLLDQCKPCEGHCWRRSIGGQRAARENPNDAVGWVYALYPTTGWRTKFIVGGRVPVDGCPREKVPTTKSATSVAKRSLSSSLRDTTRENRRLDAQHLLGDTKVLTGLDVPFLLAEDVHPVHESLFQTCNTKDRLSCLKRFWNATASGPLAVSVPTKDSEDRSDLRLWCNDLSSPEDVPVEVAS